MPTSKVFLLPGSRGRKAVIHGADVLSFHPTMGHKKTVVVVSCLRYFMFKLLVGIMRAILLVFLQSLNAIVGLFKPSYQRHQGSIRR